MRASGPPGLGPSSQQVLLDRLRREQTKKVSHVEDLANVSGQAWDGRSPVFRYGTGTHALVGPSQWFSLPGNAAKTGNCPARYQHIVDGGIGTLGTAGTTQTVFTVTILDHTGATKATFTHTVPANVLINATTPTTGKNIGPLVVDSDLINVAVTWGTGAADGLFELRYL